MTKFTKHFSLDSDHSVRGIIVSNVLAIIIAIWQDWGVLQLLWPFWIQSVIIGIFAHCRIIALRNFCVEGVTFNDQPIEMTKQSAFWVGCFFALHYGAFHLIYLKFLMALTTAGNSDGMVAITDPDSGEVAMVQFGQVFPVDFLFFIPIAMSFWLSHLKSAREHRKADLAGKPNIGTLMMLPYVRIIPMHLIFIFGSILGGGAVAVWLFAILKTIADVVMHKVEHRLLQK